MKHSLEKLPVLNAVERFVVEQRERNGGEALPLDQRAVLHLPKLQALHRDSFDQMRICQAINMIAVY